MKFGSERLMIFVVFEPRFDSVRDIGPESSLVYDRVSTPLRGVAGPRVTQLRCERSDQG